MSAPFTHLHLHTQYSLLNGAIRIKELPKALLDRGFSACAITDHGNLFGAIEFYEALKHAGLKPIIGIEAYIERKREALKCYETELRYWPHPRSIKAVAILARLRGSEVGMEAAEAFRLMREIQP